MQRPGPHPLAAANQLDYRHIPAERTHAHRLSIRVERAMSVPSSAMTSWAQMVPMPGTASSSFIWRSQGSASFSIVAVSWLTGKRVGPALTGTADGIGHVCQAMRRPRQRRGDRRQIVARFAQTS